LLASPILIPAISSKRKGVEYKKAVFYPLMLMHHLAEVAQLRAHISRYNTAFFAKLAISFPYIKTIAN
jgi:hypothetical protein